MKTKPGRARSANAKPKPWATITLCVAAGVGCVVSIGMMVRRGERRAAASEAARSQRADDETSGAAAGLARWRGVAAPQTGEAPPTSAPVDPALARAETA